MFFEIVILKNLQISHENKCWSLFLKRVNKESNAGVFLGNLRYF